MNSWLIKPNQDLIETYSGSTQVNLLFRDPKLPIYFMDNHRMGPWCWLQEIKKRSVNKFLLIHIDAHEDASPSAQKYWNENLKDHCRLVDLNLSDYQELWDQKNNVPLIRWDNYLPLFFQEFRENLQRSYACTHGIGIPGEFDERLALFTLLKKIKSLFEDFEGSGVPWIINLDLDFFFTSLPQKCLWASDEFLEEFYSLLKERMSKNEILVLTVALSPECCGSWQASLNLANKLFSQFPKITDLAR